MRVVTSVSPLRLLALTKGMTKERHPAGMSERLSPSALVATSASLTRSRTSVSPRETRLAGHAPRTPLSNRELPTVCNLAGSRPLVPFLPGSAQNVECDVTPTKQTFRKFLPGARTACQRSAFRHRFFRSSEFLTETASHSEIDVTPSKQTTGKFLTETRIVPLPGFSRAFFAKNSVCSTRFLTGSASQTEFVVTRSKQTTDEFLTGARTAISVSQFRAEFWTESQAQREKECRSRDAAEQSKILLHIRIEKELL
jgi:hypothetical protein